MCTHPSQILPQKVRTFPKPTLLHTQQNAWDCIPRLSQQHQRQSFRGERHLPDLVKLALVVYITLQKKDNSIWRSNLQPRLVNGVHRSWAFSWCGRRGGGAWYNCCVPRHPLQVSHLYRKVHGNAFVSFVWTGFLKIEWCHGVVATTFMDSHHQHHCCC